MFLTLGDRLGAKQENGLFIALTLGRQEIADLIGTTLETAIRLMSRWQKEGVVLTEKSGFVVPDVGALREMTSE